MPDQPEPPTFTVPMNTSSSATYSRIESSSAVITARGMSRFALRASPETSSGPWNPVYA